MDKYITYSGIRFLLNNVRQSILAPLILYQYKAVLELIVQCLHSSEAIELLDYINSSFPYKLYTNYSAMTSGLDIANIFDNYRPISLAYDSQCLVYIKHMRDVSPADFILACIPQSYPSELHLIQPSNPSSTYYPRIFEVKLGFVNCNLVMDKSELVGKAIYVPTTITECPTLIKSSRGVYAGEKR